MHEVPHELKRQPDSLITSTSYDAYNSPPIDLIVWNINEWDYVSRHNDEVCVYDEYQVLLTLDSMKIQLGKW